MIERYSRGVYIAPPDAPHISDVRQIREIQKRCDELWLLSLNASDSVEWPPEVRAQWFAELVPEARRLVVGQETYFKDDDERLHHLLLAKRFDSDCERAQCIAQLVSIWIAESIDIVFGALDVAPLVAKCIEGLQHTTVRFEIIDTGVDAITRVAACSNPYQYREVFPALVYRHFLRTIAVLGAESSGKTTLSEALARHYKTAWVPEFARDYWFERDRQFYYEDMVFIGQKQTELEDEMLRAARDVLVCDTTPLTTMMYSLDLFGKVDPALKRMVDLRHYDFYVLCAPDFPFVQDGSRTDDNYRQKMHLNYVRHLDAMGIPYLLVEGPTAQRVAAVVERIEANCSQPRTQGVPSIRQKFAESRPL